MTGNYWPFFCFTSHSVYLLINICHSVLFKITFEISIWHFCTSKIIKNLHTFENNFWNAFISYNRSLWADSCFLLLQIWFTYFLHDYQMMPFRALPQPSSRVLLELRWFSTCLLYDLEAYKSALQLPANWKNTYNYAALCVGTARLLIVKKPCVSFIPEQLNTRHGDIQCHKIILQKY